MANFEIQASGFFIEQLADVSDQLATSNLIALSDIVKLIVRLDGDEVIVVLDYDHVAVTANFVAAEDPFSIIARNHWVA